MDYEISVILSISKENINKELICQLPVPAEIFHQQDEKSFVKYIYENAFDSINELLKQEGYLLEIKDIYSGWKYTN